MIKQKINFILLVCIYVSVLIGYFPLKIAKNHSEYDLNSKDYIVCMETRVTGCNWTRIIKSKSENLLDAINNGMIVTEDFNFTDKTPLNSLYDLEMSNNVYVVYGEQFDKPIQDEFYDNIRYTCEQWEIVYPIKRQSIIGCFLPNGYLCIWDVVDKFSGTSWIIFELLYFLFICYIIQ